MGESLTPRYQGSWSDPPEMRAGPWAPPPRSVLLKAVLFFCLFSSLFPGPCLGHSKRLVALGFFEWVRLAFKLRPGTVQQIGVFKRMCTFWVKHG